MGEGEDQKLVTNLRCSCSLTSVLYYGSAVLMCAALAASIFTHASHSWLKETFALGSVARVAVDYGVWRYCYTVVSVHRGWAVLSDSNQTVGSGETDCKAAPGTESFLICQVLLLVGTLFASMAMIALMVALFKTMLVTRKYKLILVSIILASLYAVLVAAAVAFLANQRRLFQFKAKAEIVLSSKSAEPDVVAVVLDHASLYGSALVVGCSGIVCALVAALLMALGAYQSTHHGWMESSSYEMKEVTPAASGT